MVNPSLRRLLQKMRLKNQTSLGVDTSDASLKALQLKMLRIQQGLWHQKRRAIIVFEGFDAAGKGGAIRRLVESLDPRGYVVHPIGPPNAEEHGNHYLYRFWNKLPSAGSLAIFDRSWYGRVLVERVEKLTPRPRWQRAFKEILQFEETLKNDGIDLIKIFLAIDKGEQLRRFEQRLNDPYKSWKLTMADIEARAKWNDYVKAVDDMFSHTHVPWSQWHLIAANHKTQARIKTLEVVTTQLKAHGHWMLDRVQKAEARTLKKSLLELGFKDHHRF